METFYKDVSEIFDINLVTMSTVLQGDQQILSILVIKLLNFFCKLAVMYDSVNLPLRSKFVKIVRI